MKTLVALLLLLVCLPLQAQIHGCDSLRLKPKSLVHITYSDAAIGLAVQATTPPVQPLTIKGYRILIATETSRTQMQHTESELKHVTHQPVYLLYEQPYFRLKVGDFRTKVEAMGLYGELKAMYPSALIVPDDIQFPATQ